jgi:hypothetical protein
MVSARRTCPTTEFVPLQDDGDEACLGPIAATRTHFRMVASLKTERPASNSGADARKLTMTISQRPTQG